MATFTDPQYWQTSGNNLLKPKNNRGIVLENEGVFYFQSGSKLIFNSRTAADDNSSVLQVLNYGNRNNNPPSIDFASDKPLVKIEDAVGGGGVHPLLQLRGAGSNQGFLQITTASGSSNPEKYFLELLGPAFEWTGVYIHIAGNESQFESNAIWAGIKVKMSGFANSNFDNLPRGVDIDMARGIGIKINSQPNSVNPGAGYDSYGFYGQLNSILPSTGSAFFKINISDSYQSASESGQAIMFLQAEENSQIKIPLLKLKNYGSINGNSGIMEIEIGTQGKIKSFHQRNTNTEILDGAQPTPTYIGSSFNISGDSPLPLIITHRDTQPSLTQPTIYLDLQGTGSNAIWIHRGDSFAGRGNGNSAFIKFDDISNESGVAFFEAQSYLKLPPNPSSAVALTAVSGRLYFYNGSTWKRVSEDII